MGLALWLAPAPSSPASTSLSSLISSLASAHSTPSFHPHVTLLTGLPISAPLPALLTSLHQAIAAFHLATPSRPALALTFTGLGTHHTFFQYVFAAVEASGELRALRAAVREGLLGEEERGEEDDFFPHLSLMYGEDREGTTAEAIIGELGDGKVVGGMGGIEVDEVWVVRCEGPPEKWEVLAKVPLGVPA